MSFDNLLVRRASNGCYLINSSPQKLFPEAKKRSFLTHPHAYLERVMTAQPYLQGVELIEYLLDHFQFSFQTPWQEKERIPTEGRVIIIANHPLETLDGAAVFKLISEIRSDVKVVVEHPKHSLQSFSDAFSESPLASVILLYEMASNSESQDALPVNQAAMEFLQQEGALIFFPCDDLSRIGPGGVVDAKWRSDFLHLALAAQAPVLPVFVDAANSFLFYSLSAICKPLSSLLLVPEMHKQTGKTVSLRVGELIAHDTFSESGLPLKAQVCWHPCRLFPG